LQQSHIEHYNELVNVDYWKFRQWAYYFDACCHSRQITTTYGFLTPTACKLVNDKVATFVTSMGKYISKYKVTFRFLW